MSVIKFHFDGNTPSKKNSKQIFKTKQGQSFITSSKAFKSWHAEAILEMKRQMSHTVGHAWPIQRAEKIVISLFYEDRRRRDCTNTAESVMDLLVDAGILADDNWFVTGPLGMFPSLREKRPGWEIRLYMHDAAPAKSESHRMVETIKS